MISWKNKMNKGAVESHGYGSKTMAAENSTNELKQQKLHE